MSTPLGNSGNDSSPPRPLGAAVMPTSTPSKKRKTKDHTPKTSKRHKSQYEPANVTGESAGKSAKEKYKSALPELEATRDAAREKLREYSKLLPTIGEIGVAIADMKVGEVKFPTVAGYLNLHENKQLLDVLKAVTGDLQTLYKAHTQRYGLDQNVGGGRGANPEPQMMPNQIFNSMAQGRIQAQDLTSDQPPDLQRYPTNNTIRMHVYLLRFALAAITRDHTTGLGVSNIDRIFTGPGDPQQDRVFFEGVHNLHGEDIFRALMLWQAYRLKLSKSTVQSLDDITFYGMPTLPIFATKEVGTNTAAQQRRQTKAFHRFLSEGGVRALPGDQLIRQWATTANQGAEETASATNVAASKDVKLSDDLDTLTPEGVYSVLQICSATANFIYNDPGRQNKNLFDVIDTRSAQQKAEDDANKDLQMQEDGTRFVPAVIDTRPPS
ncbi:hypothetical protein M409DRAFT_31218, partial [Zasmidium cellare ATCC 36951]